MKTRKFTLSEVLTSHFLFFSWIDLKNNKKILSNFSSSEISVPISRYWFDKTSSLIRTGKASYKIERQNRINRYNFKKKFLVNLKTNIIENSFVLLLEPCFLYNSISDGTSTEFLR